MKSSPLPAYVANVAEEPRHIEDRVYQAMTIAAIVMLLISVVWVF